MQIKLPHLNVKEWKFLPERNLFQEFIKARHSRMPINSYKSVILKAKAEKQKVYKNMSEDEETLMVSDQEFTGNLLEFNRKRLATIKASNEFVKSWNLEYRLIERKIRAKYSKMSVSPMNYNTLSPKLSNTKSDGDRYIQILENIKKHGMKASKLMNFEISKPIINSEMAEYGTSFHKLIDDAHRKAMNSQIYPDESLNKRFNDILAKYKIS